MKEIQVKPGHDLAGLFNIWINRTSSLVRELGMVAVQGASLQLRTCYGASNEVESR